MQCNMVHSLVKKRCEGGWRNKSTRSRAAGAAAWPERRKRREIVLIILQEHNTHLIFNLLLAARRTITCSFYRNYPLLLLHPLSLAVHSGSLVVSFGRVVRSGYLDRFPLFVCGAVPHEQWPPFKGLTHPLLHFWHCCCYSCC